ncbi:hypothetical protein ABFS83_04G230500 [Erythranthe nasuta]
MEGIKLLNTWLEGERSIGFCRFLAEKTSMLRPDDITHCKYISSSKKRLPKLNLAKTLRIVVQRAEDDRSSGYPPLLPVARALFNHVWDVLKDVPRFQSEYGIILLTSFGNLVLLYMEKIETSLSTENIGQLNPKEVVFRFTPTLQSLLENPPEDIPDELRDKMIKGFIGIFSHVRDEGKIPRKLVECISIYLLKDGPDLGCKPLEIHEAVQQFVFRCWFTTHDRSLKDALVCYVKFQLSLTRGLVDGTALLEQLLDVVSKELDQMSISSVNIPRSDSTRDEKCGFLNSSQQSVVELAALVLCRACTNTSKTASTEKRARQEHVVKDIFIYWFESVSTNFERIINDVNLVHSYDDLSWTLRSLLKLSSMLLFDAPSAESSRKSSCPKNEVEKGWHVIWGCLIRSFPSFVNVTSVVSFALQIITCIKTSPITEHLIELQNWVTELYICILSSRGDPRDAFYLRQNMLRAVLGLVNLQHPAAYAVCVGCGPLLNESLGLSPLLFGSEYMEDGEKEEEQSLENLREIFDCSVEVLARIDNDPGQKANLSEYYHCIRLPQELRDQLLQEMESYILECIEDKEIEKLLLSELINICALLSNFMYCSYSTRIREEISPFFFSLGEFMLELLDHAISSIDKTYSDIMSSCMGFNNIFNNIELMVASFRSFVRSPFLSKWKEKNDTSAALYLRIVQSAERLLKSLAKLYEGCSGCRKNLHAKTTFSDLPEILAVHNPVPPNSNKNLILDMELDMDSGSSDIDTLNVDGDQISSVSNLLVNQKLDFLLIMSCFFSILPSVTWEILFHLKEKEDNPKVRHHRDFSLTSCVITLIYTCKNQHASVQIASKVDLLKVGYRSHREHSLVSLGDLVNKVFENSFLDWRDRTKLVDCICNFVSLRPQIAQLFMLLHDPDYRVKLFLARRIGVLFLTWDGHFELFQDVCSNFGVKLVVSSRKTVIRAEEVLAAGPQPSPVMETTIVTLMHLVRHSEKIELQAVFMMCVVAAIDPCQREMVCVMLDSISTELRYANRTKYMEELMGPILFCWVSCGVSLVALIETRDLYVLNAEPVNFIHYCCQWLLPALILQEETSNINKKVECDQGSRVLGTYILQIAEISEHERDELIRKRMVSIVNHTLPLASNVWDPPLPFFSKDTVACAIQTVEDGFLDSENQSTGCNLVDKINIFRCDRVFMFVVDMHYKVTAAAHHRHKCCHLAGLEVVVNLLGFRAAIPSTFNYLLNLIGQFIGSHNLVDQCCCLISHCSRYQEIIRQIIYKFSTLTQLLHCSLTITSDSSLYECIRELEPFPEIDIFDDIRRFHLGLCVTYSPRVHLLNFVKRSHYHKNMSTKGERLGKELDENFLKDAYWHSDNEIVHALWNLVPVCSLDNTNDLGAMVSAFISRVGIGDPHRVVFHLPGDSHVQLSGMVKVFSSADPNIYMDRGISNEVLLVPTRLLKKYIMDESVEMIDMASQALRGILSTEKGQQSLLHLDSYERSFIEVHSKGINLVLVQSLIAILQRKFEVVCAVISYCDDLILRLCQDIVLVKSEVAELLFSDVILNIAGSKDSNVDLCKIISLEASTRKCIESHVLTKTIQVFLHALNELRLCHVMERTKSSTSFHKQKSSKNTKLSGSGMKSRSASVKGKDIDTPSGLAASTQLNITQLNSINLLSYDPIKLS